MFKNYGILLIMWKTSAACINNTLNAYSLHMPSILYIGLFVSSLCKNPFIIILYHVIILLTSII